MKPPEGSSEGQGDAVLHVRITYQCSSLLQEVTEAPSFLEFKTSHVKGAGGKYPLT